MFGFYLGLLVWGGLYLRDSRLRALIPLREPRSLSEYEIHLKPESSEFVISRVLDVPRDLVWKCFTEPERMKQWWGPKGFTVIASKMDLRVGGTYHYGMKAPDGTPMWGKFVFREIVLPERLDFISSFSDEKGGTHVIPVICYGRSRCTRPSPSRKCPAARPKSTVRWTTHNATEEEQKTFEAGRDSMRMGWTGTMEQLEAYLAKA